ncbi:MAG: peptide chain release factor 1 [Hyphomicrobiaceae bacterium]
MTLVPKEKLERLFARWSELQEGLAGTLDQSSFASLSKEFAELDPIVEAARRLQAASAEAEDLRQMVADRSVDADMRDMALAELPEVEARIETLNHDLRLLLLPKDEADDRSVILEVRAGTGGDEAALFAADLFRMYNRYADLKGWRTEIIDASPSDLGGYRELIAAIRGNGVFARLKYESGVHRVQRVPATEASGRIHTSAATVAVLPEAEDIDVELRPEDIRIDTMRASGAGGQHVNTTDSAVRITHLPTGLIVVASEKSQHQNRKTAMQILRARLFEMERERADLERAAERKAQVGSGDRSQRIRTYNFPQGRVTDHRINLTLHKLDQVIAGAALDELIDALVLDRQSSELAAIEGRVDV